MKKKRWRRRRRRRRRRTCQGHLFPRSVAMVTGRWTKKKKKRSHESRERRRRVYYYHHFFQRIHNIQECHGNFLFECVCVCVFRLLSPHRLCLRWQRRFDVDFFFLPFCWFCFVSRARSSSFFWSVDAAFFFSWVLFLSSTRHMARPLHRSTLPKKNLNFIRWGEGPGVRWNAIKLGKTKAGRCSTIFFLAIDSVRSMDWKKNTSDVFASFSGTGKTNDHERN